MAVISDLLLKAPSEVLLCIYFVTLAQPLTGMFPESSRCGWPVGVTNKFLSSLLRRACQCSDSSQNLALKCKEGGRRKFSLILCSRLIALII